MITLQAADGGKFNVSKTVARKMGTVTLFLQEDNEEKVDRSSQPDHTRTTTLITIPLFNVSSSCLVKVIEYCQAHLQFEHVMAPEEEVEAFDSGLVKNMSDDMIKQLILSANYLDVKDLLDMLVKTIAKRIENKSVEYVRKLFNVECDFSSEEEARIRQENSFAFQGIDED